MPEILPQPVINWINENNFSLQNRRQLTGGCVAVTELLILKGVTGGIVEVVLKQMQSSGDDVLLAEAEGLNALKLEQSGALCVPEVYLSAPQCLLMEYLAPCTPASDYDQQLALGLAIQHQQTKKAFGFKMETYCGGTLQTNSWDEKGHRFFAEQRLMALGKRCYEKALLSESQLAGLENLCWKLPELIPDQPAVLLHGDLWSGNVITAPEGRPAIIDPAVWYGWAEAELAMTRMFGGFSSAFYSAYREVSDIDPGWKNRTELYNLYHYLNHLLLFGGSYHSDVIRIVKYYNG